MGFVHKLRSFPLQSLIHSSTGFTFFFLTFDSEARLPPDSVFGFVAFSVENVRVSGRTSGTPLTLLLKSFSILSHAFASVIENLHSFHQREKDRYDLGAIESVQARRSSSN